MGGKIGITMRQPFLGKIDWIEQDIRRAKGPREEKAA
jgi:DNA-directed RNA polymerase subunit E'/Rpb7